MASSPRLGLRLIVVKTLAIGAVAVLLAGLLGEAKPSRSASADDAPSVAFSRPLPIQLNPPGVYLTCLIDHFGRPQPIHEWKIRHRSVGVVSADLVFEAVSTSPDEAGGAFELVARDRLGIQSVVVRGVAGRPVTAPLGLSLEGGTAYSVSIKRLESPDAVGAVHHYRLGSSDPKLEIGWSDPLQYLESHGEWAFHTDAGEAARLTLLVDTEGAGPPAEQASRVTVEVVRPEGGSAFPPTTYSDFPVRIALPAGDGGTFIARTDANGHLRMRKETGTDIGLYGVQCTSPPDALAAAAQDSGVGSSLRRSGGDGVGTARLVGIGGGIAGVLALSLVGVGAWYWMRRRPKPLPAGLENAVASGPGPNTAVQPEGGNGRVPGEVLTTRELEVVGLIAEGLTNQQIAERLVISRSTAKRHVENILQKLGLGSRAQVAAWAERQGSHR